jgi:Helix-turn-helix domain
MKGRTVRTPQKQADFLRLLAEGNSVGEAAAAIGCQRRTVYDWRDSNNEFRRAWDAALDQATEAIESVLYARARGGDLLACIFWLKSHRPAVYNRKQFETVGSAATAPPVTIVSSRPRLYLPANFRDWPEPEPTIEVEGDEGEEAA